MRHVLYDEDGSLGVVVESGRGSLPFALCHGEALVEAEEPLVLHDPLCPMTPADFIAACVERCATTQAVVIGVRPVTASVVAGMEGLASTDFATLAADLAARFPVVTMQAPPEGRRVGDEDDVRVLEALTVR